MFSDLPFNRPSLRLLSVNILCTVNTPIRRDAISLNLVEGFQ